MGTTGLSPLCCSGSCSFCTYRPEAAVVPTALTRWFNPRRGRGVLPT